MRLCLNFILIYLISNSKWILVESSDLAGTDPSGSLSTPGTDGTGSSISQSGDNSENQASIAGDGGSVAEGSGSALTESSADGSTTKTGFDLDIGSANQSTNEFEYEKVGEYATYTAKDNYAFKLVKDGSTELWKASNANEYSTKVEVDLMNNDSKAVTVFASDDKTKIFIRSGTGQPWNEIDTSTVNPKSININYPHQSYFYKNELRGETRTFTSKNGFAFKGANDYVNNQKVEIWKTDEESEYANKIVNEGGKKVTLHLADGSTKVIQKGSDGKWPPDTETSKTGVDLNIKSDKKSNKKIEYKKDGQYVTYIAKDEYAFKLVKDDNVEIWKSSDNRNYASKVEVDLIDDDSKAVTIFLCKNKTKVFKKDCKNDPWNEIDTTKVTPNSINIDYPHESYFYTNELEGRIRTFTAKKGFAFKGANEYVNNNKVEIWKTDNETEYSNKIQYAKRYSDKLDVTIYLLDGKKKLFIKESADKCWKEIDITVINPMSMNIKYDKETYFYSNKIQNSKRTFEARDGFAFNVVNEYINNDKVEIWKTSKESEYSKVVVVEGNNKVIIYIGDDGIAKVFGKGADGKWEEDSSAASTVPPMSASSTQPKVKLLKVNPSDATKFSELGSNEYSSNTSGDVTSYQIANGVNCVQLKFGDVLLWQHDPNQRGGIYPESVYHNTNADILVLRFTGLDLTFENTSDGWLFNESGPLAVKFHVVDPSDATKTVELARNHFILNESDHITTFTINSPVNPIALMYGQDLLWEHAPNHRGGKYPKSLDFTATTETLVLKFDGVDIKFEKNAQGGWEYTETDTSGSGTPSTPESGEGAPTTPAPQTGSSTQPQVKLLKANASDPNNPLELVTNEYTSNTSGDVTSYQIANGVNCVQLIFGQVLLWEHDQNQRGGIYPKSVYHYTNTNVLVLRFTGLDLRFENTNDGWIFTESGPLAVKFYIVDPNDSSNSVELGSKQFTITESGDITTFNIADGVNCNKLLYSFVLLWVYDSTQHGGKYPKSLDFTTSTETLVLKFEGLDIKFAKNTEGGWEYTETQTSGGSTATSGNGTSQPSSGTTTSDGANQTSGGEGSQGTTQPEAGANQNPEETSQ